MHTIIPVTDKAVTRFSDKVVCNDTYDGLVNNIAL